MQAALVEAMSLGEPLIAASALHTLAQTGSVRLLKATEGRPAPVVAALNYPDSRVQFAAASTILTWDPTTPFRGVSRVIEVLARALNDTGKAHGVAIDANEQRATSMSSALIEMGFEPEIAQTGQDGFKIAAERGDVALLLIEANVARWELSQTIANLRLTHRIHSDCDLRRRQVADTDRTAGRVVSARSLCAQHQRLDRHGQASRRLSANGERRRDHTTAASRHTQGRSRLADATGRPQTCQPVRSQARRKRAADRHER